MSTHVLLDAKIYIAGRDCSGDHNAIDLPWSVAELAAGTFGSRTQRYLAGAENWTLTGQGFQSYGNGSDISNYLRSLKGKPDTTFTVGGGESGVGLGWTFTGVIVDASPMGGEWGALHGFRFRAVPAVGEPLREVQLLTSSGTAIGANGASAVVALGPLAAAQTLYCRTEVVAPVTGPGGRSLTLSVESAPAADMVGATVRATFPAITDVGVWTVSVPGPVTDGFWRVAWTITAGASFPCTIVLYIQ
jgi:hypothetical protein